MRRRRPVSVSQLVVVREGSIDPQTVRREFGEGNRAAVAYADATIDKLYLLGRAAEPSGCGPHLSEQRRRTLEHRRTSKDRRARVKGAVALFEVRGRAMEHAH